MTMQYDVSSVHINQTGFGYVGRTRVKSLLISSTATGGTVHIFDTSVAPVTGGTYSRSGYVVTVSSTAHGLSTGYRVGIVFAVGTGGSATNGNYTITVTDANTFTLTDINTGTISATPAATYVSSVANGTTQWHMSIDTAAAAGTTSVVIPGEGLLIETALYITMTATQIPALTVFYG